MHPVFVYRIFLFGHYTVRDRRAARATLRDVQGRKQCLRQHGRSHGGGAVLQAGSGCDRPDAPGGLAGTYEGVSRLLARTVRGRNRVECRARGTAVRRDVFAGADP